MATTTTTTGSHTVLALELRLEIARAQRLLKLEANKDPRDQEWLRGRINGLRYTLAILGE